MRRIITSTLALVLTLIVMVTSQPARLLAAEQPHPAALATQDLSLEQAQAVVDAGGNLKAFARMDGAWLGSIDIATKGAHCALLRSANRGVGRTVAAGW